MTERIREIAILIEQVNRTMGATLNILNGVESNATTEKGSIAYKMHFEEAVKKIKGLVLESDYLKQKIESGVPLNNFQSAVYNMIDEYKKLDEIIKHNLSGLKIDLNENPVLRDAARKALGNSSLTSLNFNDFNNIIEAGSKNTDPFGDTNAAQIAAGEVTMGFSCPDGKDKCVGVKSASPSQALQEFLTGQITCVTKMFINLVKVGILTPLAKLTHSMENDPIKPFQKGLFITSVGRLAALLVVTPATAIIYGVIMAVTVMMTMPWFYRWIAKNFCTSCTIAGATISNDYNSICVDNSIFTKTIYSVVNSGTTRYYDQEYVKVDNSIATVNWRTSGDGTYPITYTELETSDYSIYNTYSIFEKEPVFVDDPSLTTTGTELDEDELNAILTAPRIGEIAYDAEGNLLWIPVVPNDDPTMCAGATQTAFTMLIFLLADMVTNPSKYNIEDSADILAYSIKISEFSNVDVMGRMLGALKLGDEADEYNVKMQSLYSTTKRGYESIMNYLQKPYKDTDAGNLNLLSFESNYATFGGFVVDFGQILALPADASAELYKTLRQLITKDTGYQIACCLVGEFLEKAIGEVQKNNLTLSLENILEQYNKFIDYLIAVLTMAKQLAMPDFESIINRLLKMGQNMLISLMTSWIPGVYASASAIIKNNIKRPDNAWGCLPFNILADLLDSVLRVIFARITQFMNLFVGSFQLSLNNLQYDINRIAMLSVINEFLIALGKLKMTPGDFYNCLEMNDKLLDTIPDEDIVIDNDNSRPVIKFGDGSGGDNNVYNKYKDKILLYRSSKKTGYPIFINKRKLQTVLERVVRGDPVALSQYINDKKRLEVFGERQHATERLSLVKEILDYYKVR